MLSYNDDTWNEMQGGYRGFTYNPVPALQKIEAHEATEATWDELWQELHHQGDVGEASYAAVAKLIEVCPPEVRLGSHFYPFIIVIERARQEPHNPQLPEWLQADYYTALQQLQHIAAQDLKQATNVQEIVAYILGALAVTKKQYELAELLLDIDEALLAYDRMREAE